MNPHQASTEFRASAHGEDPVDFFEREKLRVKMIENAAEINRLARRVRATAQLRSVSDALKREWEEACAEWHLRYNELCLPGGPYPVFYDQLRAGDLAMIEVALCFLEVRPYFFRSGYHWKTILQKCNRAPMSAEQAERFATIREKYREWRRLRELASTRGKIVRRDLWPLLRRFYDLFPIKFTDGHFDGLVTVGDLYRLLCTRLKIQPDSDPTGKLGTVRIPRRPGPASGTPMWAKEYAAWRWTPWTPEDVWATLVSVIQQVYGLDASTVVSPDTILRKAGSE